MSRLAAPSETPLCESVASSYDKRFTTLLSRVHSQRKHLPVLRMARAFTHLMGARHEGCRRSSRPHQTPCVQTRSRAEVGIRKDVQPSSVQGSHWKRLRKCSKSAECRTSFQHPLQRRKTARRIHTGRRLTMPFAPWAGPLVCRLGPLASIDGGSRPIRRLRALLIAMQQVRTEAVYDVDSTPVEIPPERL